MAPRGRPPVAKKPTRFLNSKRRVIYETAEGKFVVKSEKGTTYNPKAAFVKSPAGTERKLANTKARPPMAIRPKATRQRRIDTGVKRGPRAGVHAGNLARLFATPMMKKSPMWNLPNPHLRRVRKNKGMKRGPRAGVHAGNLARLFK